MNEKKIIKRCAAVSIVCYFIAVGIYVFIHPSIGSVPALKEDKAAYSLVSVPEEYLDTDTYRYTNLIFIDDTDSEVSGTFCIDAPSYVKISVYSDGITKINPMLGNIDEILLCKDGVAEIADHYVIKDNTNFCTIYELEKGNYELHLIRDEFSTSYRAGNIKVGVDVKIKDSVNNINMESAKEISLNTPFSVEMNGIQQYFKAETETGYLKLECDAAVTCTVMQNNHPVYLTEDGYPVNKGTVYIIVNGSSSTDKTIRISFTKNGSRSKCADPVISDCHYGDTKISGAAVKNETVKIQVNGKSYNIKAKNDGTFSVKLLTPLQKGDVISAAVDGNNYYSGTASVKAKAKNLKKPEVTGYENGKLTGKAQEGSTVSITINKKTMKTKISKKKFSLKVSIKSGDIVSLYVTDSYGNKSGEAKFKAQ